MISSRDEAVLMDSGERTESVAYSFAKDGGAAATYQMGRLLPEGAIVVSVLLDEISATDLASLTVNAGSTALVSAADLTAGAGIRALTLAGSAAGIKVSESEINLVFGDAVTAGEFRLFIRYVLPNDQ